MNSWMTHLRCLPIRSLDVFFANEEQQVIRIDGFLFGLEQEVANKNLRPLSVSLKHDES